MQYHVQFPGLGIDSISVSREAFRIFGISVYWYGILIALAVLLCMVLAVRQASRYALRSEDVYDVFLILIPSILICARLYYVVFSWSQFRDDWLKIIDTRQGGMAFYGGVIGGILTLVGVSLWKKRSLLNWMDFFVVYLPLGQAIGRWGNFVNQEAFGTNTSLPWGMISEGTTQYLQHAAIPGVDPLLPVHPTFLYESLGNLLIFAVLLWVRRRAQFHLETTAWYLMLYGILRFLVESIRTDALFIGNTGIRVSMALSFVMFVVGFVYLGVLMFGTKRMERTRLVKDWEAPRVWGSAEVPDRVEAETEAEEDGFAAEDAEIDTETPVLADAQRGISPEAEAAQVEGKKEGNDD